MIAFSTGRELLELTAEERIPVSKAMLLREISREEHSEEEIIGLMASHLEAMRNSVKQGLEEVQNSVSGLSGGDSEMLMSYSQRSIMGKRLCRMVAASMAVVEVNASMGKIVAAPTAGGSGVLPGALLGCDEEFGFTDQQLIMALFNAAAIGMIVATHASISGAEGGCQAETGTAAAMAASALVELRGGTPAQCLDAAAMALKNVMGLVCDPVAGLVECPCIKRNAMGTANAALCADLALAGIKSLIPFDEVVMAMKSVGRQMNPDLKETARGGLAATPTAKALKKKLLHKDADEEA